MKQYESNARDVDDLIFGDGSWNSSERLSNHSIRTVDHA